MELEETKSVMHTGKIYFCKEERLMAEQMGYLDRVYDFKQTRPAEIQVGDHVMFAPEVAVAAGTHPICPPL